MRDRRDNVVVVCSIENLDPMGVHTGDSVTVAPQMTLSDEAYQELRDAALRVIRAVGVETGGANIQFARERDTGELRVIEMNPRVSRSSALASKATGYPIAKVAAKLSVGYTLDEIPNDLTRTTPASFEPTLDYVVVKFPRFAFEKFPGADRTLGTQMKSVGRRWGSGAPSPRPSPRRAGRGRSTTPGAPTTCIPGSRPSSTGSTRLSRVSPRSTTSSPTTSSGSSGSGSRTPSSPPAAAPPRRPSAHVAARGECGRSTAASTRAPTRSRPRPRYYYSTWGELDEAPPARPASRGAVVIVGSGPNRIGQGIEFDYCCVHAAQSFRALGFEAVMVNCNPETVSTDYDTSDRLYFEPLRVEEVLAVCERERPAGVVIQFGGQTPLKLARALEAAGWPILGTPFDAVDLAEDRERFAALCDELGVRVPEWGMARGGEEAAEVAERDRLPRAGPPFVRARRLATWSSATTRRPFGGPRPKAPRALVDRFLESALEIDVDAVSDGEDTWVAAVMQHVEEAGVHSGDSSCVLPAPGISAAVHAEIEQIVGRLARALGVVGVLNVQLAVAEGEVFVLEVNPRASRTLPFASKAIGVNLVDAACRVAAGARLAELDVAAYGPTHTRR